MLTHVRYYRLRDESFDWRAALAPSGPKFIALSPADEAGEAAWSFAVHMHAGDEAELDAYLGSDSWRAFQSACAPHVLVEKFWTFRNRTT